MLVIAALLVGAIVPVQTAINTRFRESIGSPIVAGFFSFIIGLFVSALIALALTGHLIPDLATAAQQPWWVWLGGFMGVSFIVGNILLFPRIGSVETVILPILGQVTMGLLCDTTGIFNSPHVGVGPLRILGVAVVLVGIALVLEIGRGAATTHATASGVKLWLWRLFGVLIGMGSATQTAVNGFLGRALGNPLPAGSRRALACSAVYRPPRSAACSFHPSRPWSVVDVVRWSPWGTLRGWWGYAFSHLGHGNDRDWIVGGINCVRSGSRVARLGACAPGTAPYSPRSGTGLSHHWGRDGAFALKRSALAAPALEHQASIQ